MRGRKPLSNVQKLLAGSREPLNRAEPVLPAGDVQALPELNERASRLWNRLAPHLTAAGIATAVDTDRLARTCRWEAIGDRLLDEAERQTGRKRSELIRLAASCHALADKTWTAMGVGDPRERARMHAAPQETDELAAFKRRHA